MIEPFITLFDIELTHPNVTIDFCLFDTGLINVAIDILVLINDLNL